MPAINYLVGPNGSGKTRALMQLCDKEKGWLIPRQRPVAHSGEFGENDTERILREAQSYVRNSPEQVAMSLLRENAKLRYKVFMILSRKLGRNFSVEIVDRSQNFKITSGLNNEYFKEVKVPRYELSGESSGLRELLILLTLINSGKSNKYFIDEPELSLHPEAQRFLKNEMLRLVQDNNIQFWLATHSPIFFAPETIGELESATFFADPQVSQGSKPDFSTLSTGQRLHLEKSLLRLDSEKWLLVHAKGVIFCEGFRDKAIFKKVMDKCEVDISRSDFSIVETGGKDDFSTLHLLCKAISKPSYYIGDLDNLIESKLLDKFNDHPDVLSELSGIATNIQDYISANIRTPLGFLIENLLKIPVTDFQLRDASAIIFPHRERISRKSDNSKSLALELFITYPSVLKTVLANPKTDPIVDLLTQSTTKAISILKKAGFLILSTGSLETLFHAKPVSPEDDKEKIKLFDAEYLYLTSEEKTHTETRYQDIISFIRSIIRDDFDNRKFLRSELVKLVAKIQAILLEQHPSDAAALGLNAKYRALKVTDLFTIVGLSWHGESFEIHLRSSPGFDPAFEIKFNSTQGVTSEKLITFT